MMSAQQPEGHYALAKLQISVDFAAGFGRNMTEDVANLAFFLLEMSECGGNFVLLRAVNKTADNG